MKKVVFADPARKALIAQLKYIRQRNPNAARRIKDEVKQATLRLSESPHSGRPLSEFPHAQYREVIVRPLRLFYRLEDDVVLIVAVWHTSQSADEP
ncbi:MAG: type II toxin-antitoxin system RelE/ParE family toxin [Bradymonadia bacterium]